MDPRGTPPPAPVLNSIIPNCILKTYAYTHRELQSLLHIIEASFGTRWRPLKKATVDYNTENLPWGLQLQLMHQQHNPYT